MGPVSVHPRTPDTTALATITVSIRITFVACIYHNRSHKFKTYWIRIIDIHFCTNHSTVTTLYLLCASVNAVHLYNLFPVALFCLQTTHPLPQPPPRLPQVMEPHTQTISYNGAWWAH